MGLELNSVLGSYLGFRVDNGKMEATGIIGAIKGLHKDYRIHIYVYIRVILG